MILKLTVKDSTSYPQNQVIYLDDVKSIKTTMLPLEDEGFDRSMLPHVFSCLTLVDLMVPVMEVKTSDDSYSYAFKDDVYLMNARGETIDKITSQGMQPILYGVPQVGCDLHEDALAGWDKLTKALVHALLQYDPSEVTPTIIHQSWLETTSPKSSQEDTPPVEEEGWTDELQEKIKRQLLISADSALGNIVMFVEAFKTLGIPKSSLESKNAESLFSLVRDRALKVHSYAVRNGALVRLLNDDLARAFINHLDGRRVSDDSSTPPNFRRG